MLIEQIKTLTILGSAITCLGIALTSESIFISKICASLSIIILAYATSAMQDKSSINQQS